MPAVNSEAGPQLGCPFPSDFSLCAGDKDQPAHICGHVGLCYIKIGERESETKTVSSIPPCICFEFLP